MKNRTIELRAGTSMIEQVIADYEREHPGHDAAEMTGKEFTDRMMEKMKETARFTDEAKH
jgi:hypothetical protein